MQYRVTNEWTLTLPDDFESRVEEGKLVFWKIGITIIVVAFRLPDNTGKIELLNQIQKRIPENAFETLVSTKGEIVGLGYTQIHQRQDEKNRLSLYTFTASNTSCLQTAFYLDHPTDLDWAKSVWEMIVFHPAPEKETKPDSTE